VTVTATPRSSLATITVDGRSTPRGIPSHEIVLNVDPTLVYVTVRAEDGTAITYIITIHRADS